MKAFPYTVQRITGVVALFFLQFSSSLISAEPDHNSLSGREILALQSLAMAQTSYTGLLTYEHGTHLATIEVDHQVVDGVEHESLVHLNGEERTVKRDSDDSRCPSPGELLIRGAHPRGIQLTQDIDAYYHISVLGTERVAGREATVVQVMPRDQYRYGYIVSVDQASYLALKILLVGPGAKVMERFQFSKLSITEPESALPTLSEAMAAIDCKSRVVEISNGWKAHWLPPGFVYAGQKSFDSSRLMMMYTDGLAAFSIFIDKLDAPTQIEGRAQRGATVAYLGRVENVEGDYRVTVVGEVPPAALERVALSLRNEELRDTP